MKIFLFDQPYFGAVAFDSHNCKITQNSNLSFEKTDPKIPIFQQSTRSTSMMQIFKDLFEMADYELLCRMDEDKIMKTLNFINGNVKENNLFCLATFSTSGEKYSATIKSRPQKQSKVVFGHVIVFVIENVQELSNDKDKKALNSLLKGDIPAEFSNKNVTILTNYQEICKKYMYQTARFFKSDLKQQSITPIPMFVTFEYNSSVNEIKSENSHLFPCLKFAINILLGNFYQCNIFPENSAGQKTSMELFNSVCFKTKKFSNQGPFHKWKLDIMPYMDELVQLKHLLKRIFCDFNAWNQYIASVFHCLELLQELIRKDYIPNQNSWILVDYKNLHGQKKSIVLLEKKSAKNWDKQLVITSKDWIAPLKEICGDENEHGSKGENIILKDYVWLYDETDNSNEPYLLIQNEKFTIGICKGIIESSRICEHLNRKENIQYFCILCKRNVEFNACANRFNCNRGAFLNFKIQCLSCWRSNLSTSIDNKEECEEFEQIHGSKTESHQQSKKEGLISENQQNNVYDETGTSQRTICGDELKRQLEEEKFQRQKMLTACQNKDEEIGQLKEIEKTLKENIRNLNAQIGELQNELKTHQSNCNEALKKINNLTEQYQQLKRKNNENEQTINYLRMEIAQLLENEKDLNDKLTKANDNEIMLQGEKQKLNAEIMKLEKELETHQLIINEALEGNNILTKENQQLKEKNNENEQTINNLQMEISRLLEVEKDLNGKLTKANGKIEILENPKTYTIVVVGATGVGKSTLISAMENYLKWPKLEDAAKHLNELEIRIPVQFTVTRKTGQSQVVSAGFADDKIQKNENFNNSGESVTQKPKVHLFKYGNDTVRIIDTPGLADTRGSDQDEINLKLIQKMVKNQEQIHGICIFIKSNDSKLTPQFEMTVRQLLSVFPKSALNNVFFFFTHCVGTFFGVGDVMNPLKELQKKYEESHGSTFSLEWNKMHCVDSESFRYLVCRKQNVEYSTRSEADFYYAWDESSKEISKFFETVKTIKPIPANKIEASRKLAKWTDAMKQKGSIVTPEQQEPYFHLMNCLTFMAKKHTLVLNKSEFKTNIQVLSEFEFYEAINGFLEVAEDGGRRLQKCKEIVKTLESG